MKRIIVLGKSLLALRLCDWLMDSSAFRLVGVVPCNPTPTWFADLGDWARLNDVQCAFSGRLEDLHGVSADILLSCYFDRIIKETQISQVKYALNIHNSSLPSHRGVGPIEWSMRDGTGFQGVTLHEMDAGIDTGAIYGQVKFKIWPHQTNESLHALCMEYAFAMTRSVLLELDRIVPTRQDEIRSSYHTRVETEEMMRDLEPE